MLVFPCIVEVLYDEDGIYETEIGSEIGLKRELVGEDAAD